jgi:hypothetical protein
MAGGGGQKAALGLSIFLWFLRASAYACGPPTLETVRVIQIIDRSDIALADGRRLRLAGTRAPADIRSLLEERLLGADVAIGLLSEKPDRWKRLPALVFIQTGAGPQWLQAEGLAQGWLQAWPEVDVRECWPLLLSAERPAIRQGIGLWRNAGQVLTVSADSQTAQPAEGDRVIEARVVRFGEGRRHMFLGLTTSMKTSPFAMILKQREAEFMRMGIDLRQLPGKRIRLRGFLSDRKLVLPQQIEVLD